jgi:outer membrane protein OmpA-like peptidoglycan-associated protein
MKTMHMFILATLGMLVAACATMAPEELVNARAAYQNASEGPARHFVPTELHKAHEALILAEESFQQEPDSFKTKDLAYVAQRKSELAGALGVIAGYKSRKSTADADFQKRQAELVKQGKQDLSDAEKREAETLAATTADNASRDKADEVLRKQQAELASKNKQALSDSEKRTAAAVAELSKLAAVKEDERGLVVTLSGSILFRSAESTLLASAREKLAQVVNALLSVRERNIIVEGNTDSQGSESYNQDLSQRRADAVRDFLVQRGYPSDRIRADGKGEGNPIADNASPEGRANNRRVEIVIERELSASN